MQTTTLTQRDPEIERFRQLVQQGIDAWTQAGEIVARAIDADSEWPEKVLAQCPQFTAEIIFRFEQIGRKAMLPQLLVNDCPGYRRLRQLPYDLQTKLVTHGVEVLAMNGSEWDSITIEPINLTDDQSKQVFAKNRIRSLAEQRAFIESAKVRGYIPSSKSTEAYRIRNGRLMVTRPVEFTRKELARILSELEP